MTDSAIANYVLQLWQQHTRTHQSPSGWVAGNAVCCEHRGHRADRRGRGGVRADHTGVVYSCFNCGFSAGYTVGQPLGLNLRRWLHWLGLDQQQINTLRLAALAVTDAAVQQLPELPQWENRPLPDACVPLHAAQHPEHAAYVLSRGLSLDSCDFQVCESANTDLQRRVIIPYRWQGQLVGWGARSIDAECKQRYIQSVARPHVFGADAQQHSWHWVPVVEGIFDALAVQGIATLGNKVSEAQAELIHSVHAVPVLVPDQDSAGWQLVQSALQWGWAVSFPNWPHQVKDVCEAVQRWGQLFVLRHIWACRETNLTTIALRLHQHQAQAGHTVQYRHRIHT